MFDFITGTMLEMPLQNHLAGLVQCRFCGIDLRENILARDVLGG